MHVSIGLFAFLAAMFVAAGCQSSGAPAKASDSVAMRQVAPAQATSTASHTATLFVHGMACPQCASNVDRQLLKVPGVEDVKVNMGTGKVTVNLSSSNPPTRDQLAKAIEETGFTLVRIDM